MRRMRLRKLAFALAPALVLFGGAELALRLLLPPLRTATLPEGEIRAHLEGGSFRYDPDLYWYWAELPHGLVNAQGFRGTDPTSLEPTPGSTRVVTFGDSQTFGAGVDDHETYSAVAERELGPGWEVLNAGISGYRSLQVYRLLHRRVAAFHPQIVVVDCIPMDSVRDDGPTVNASLHSHALERLAWNSALIYVLRYGWFKMRFREHRWLDTPAKEIRPDATGYGNHDLIDEWARGRGITAVFLEYPVTRDDFELACHTSPGELPPGAPVVEACRALMESGHSGEELFQDRNHLTVLGNEIVGGALAETLVEIGPRADWSPPSAPSGGSAKPGFSRSRSRQP